MKNATEPVAPLPLTVAVNVTDSPGAADVRESASDVALTPVPTTCESVPELAALFVSLLYVAVIVCVPVASADVAGEVAVAGDPLRFVVPSVVASALNVTVPVGVVVLPVTVALKVTLLPNDDGFALLPTVVVVELCPTVKLPVPLEPPSGTAPDPAYVAERLCVPIDRFDSVTDA